MGPQTIAKLVNITPITMVYDTYNYSIHGVYKPTNITGGATKNVLGVYLSVETGRILAELPYNRDAAMLLQYIYKWALKKCWG